MRLIEYGSVLDVELVYLANLWAVEEIGKLSLELSDKFRATAIMALLVEASSDGFYYNLIYSGLARKIYLQRLKKAGIEKDHHFVSGWYEPLLDAITAAEFCLARDIVDLTPREWQEGHEHEEDYCYAQLLHRLVQEMPDEKELALLLDQFEACLENRPRSRVKICRALVEMDQAGFEKNFNALLDEQEVELGVYCPWDYETFQKKFDKLGGFDAVSDLCNGDLDDEGAQDLLEEIEKKLNSAQRQVSVDGLALLRLAEARGLTTQLDYRYCPALARVPMETPFPVDKYGNSLFGILG